MWLENKAGYCSLPVLVRATVAMTKRHDQKRVEEKRVYWAHIFHIVVTTEGNQDQNSSRAGNYRQ